MGFLTEFLRRQYETWREQHGDDHEPVTLRLSEDAVKGVDAFLDRETHLGVWNHSGPVIGHLQPSSFVHLTGLDDESALSWPVQTIAHQQALSRVVLEDNEFDRNSFMIRADARMALSFFDLLHDPRPPLTPAEQAAFEEQQRERRVEAWAAYDAFHAEWEAITHRDPVTAKIARLHAPVFYEYSHGPICEGCDAQGMEVEYTESPCSTLLALAEVHHVTLTPLVHRWMLDERPDGSKPPIEGDD